MSERVLGYLAADPLCGSDLFVPKMSCSQFYLYEPLKTSHGL